MLTKSPWKEGAVVKKTWGVVLVGLRCWSELKDVLAKKQMNIFHLYEGYHQWCVPGTPPKKDHESSAHEYPSNTSLDVPSLW